MAKSIFSLSALASETGKNYRTVAGALRNVPPDGKTSAGGDGWRLATALRALQQRQRTRSDNAYDGESDGTADAIERAAASVEDALGQLRAAANVEAARKLVHDGVGAAIGRLDQALAQGAADCAPHERELLNVVRSQIVGSAVGELMQVCNWQVDA